MSKSVRKDEVDKAAYGNHVLRPPPKQEANPVVGIPLQFNAELPPPLYGNHVNGSIVSAAPQASMGYANVNSAPAPAPQRMALPPIAFVPASAAPAYRRSPSSNRTVVREPIWKRYPQQMQQSTTAFVNRQRVNVATGRQWAANWREHMPRLPLLNEKNDRREGEQEQSRREEQR